MDPQPSPRELWQATLEELKLQLTGPTFSTWLSDTQGVALREDTLSVVTPTEYGREWLTHRLRPVIERALAQAAGRPLQVSFTSRQLNPSKTRPAKARAPDGAGAKAQPTDEMPVELWSFDPTQRGFVMCSNYALRFWQPYLGPRPWALWLTLRAFAWDSQRQAWPSIQTLADICANSSRHAILGRNSREGRSRINGALDVLERERIVWPTKRGSGSATTYTFRVLDTLPLLTPQQVVKLTPNLQRQHVSFLKRCRIAYAEWEQLTLPNLTQPMSRT